MKMRVMLAVVAAACVAASLNAQVQKKEFPGVRNYSRVDATVGCGGQVDPAAMAARKAKDSCPSSICASRPKKAPTSKQGRAAAQAAGLKYIHLPFNAASPDPKVVDNFLAAVADRAISRCSSTADRRAG